MDNYYLLLNKYSKKCYLFSFLPSFLSAIPFTTRQNKKKKNDPMVITFLFAARVKIK